MNMSYKYKYKGASTGIQTFFVGGDRFTVGGSDYPKISSTVELKVKLTEKEQAKLNLVPVEQEKTSKKTKRGEM